jgi:hypothetical protein
MSADILQIVGLVLNAIVIPSLIALVKVLLKLHIDVRMLIDKVESFAHSQALIALLKDEVGDIKYRVKSIEERLTQ